MTPDNSALAGAQHHSPQEIETWLQRKIALLLGVEAADIDPAEPLAALGLDSVMAVCLMGELELFLDTALPDQLISPQASIRELASQLIVD